MSETSDAEKIQAALKELEPWAEAEISHLERQFAARKQTAYLPLRVRRRVSFIGGVLCGLVIAATLLYWFHPQLCNP